MVLTSLLAILLASPEPPGLPVYPGAQRLAHLDAGVPWRRTYQANVSLNKVALWYSKLWRKPVQVIRKLTIVGLVLEDLRDPDCGMNEKIMVKGVELRPGSTKRLTIFTLVSGKMSEGKNLRSVDVQIPDILKTLPLDLPLPAP